MKEKIFCLLCVFFVFNCGFCGDRINVRKYSQSLLIEHIKKSVNAGENLSSKLPPEIFALKGMSSNKGRSFLNNLCTLKNASYLEIGVWQGSTFISALYGNSDSIANAIAIDNWSEFGGPKEEFVENCVKYISDTNYKFVSGDCFSLNLNEIITSPIDIYFFDGAHDPLSQELALTYYDMYLNDLFILVVDDWNYPPAQDGTYRAIKKLGYNILYDVALPADYIGDTKNWWNGMYVALISKK